MLANSYVNTLLFGVYPYICLVVLLIGSLIRFDREPYTWKSDSSQMLRKRELRLGSNLFHYGVIIVILGHFAGFLAPHWAVDWALTPVAHQLLAMVVGGTGFLGRRVVRRLRGQGLGVRIAVRRRWPVPPGEDIPALTEPLAKAISEILSEVIIAPDFEPVGSIRPTILL